MNSEALGTIESEGVDVNYVALGHGGAELLFSVEFTGNGVGGVCGDVPSLDIVSLGW